MYPWVSLVTKRPIETIIKQKKTQKTKLGLSVRKRGKMYELYHFYFIKMNKNFYKGLTECVCMWIFVYVYISL